MSAPAPVAPVSPDTLITVKVAYNDSVRRFKLPLRELGPNVLPGKLRSALAIEDGQDVTFERFSDSAGSFIVLDATVPSVYKQLYRAAKAKGKLRLKATIQGADSAASTSAPAPPSYSQVSLLSPQPDTPTAAAPDFPSVTPITQNSLAPAPAVLQVAEVDTGKKIDQAVADAILKYLNSEEYNDKLRNSVCEEVAKQSRVPSTASVSSTELPPVPKLPAAPDLSDPDRVLCGLNSPAGFMVYCNTCHVSIDGSHYHCSSCDGGDFDLCEACIEKGEHCEQDHWLIKRHLKAGQFVSSVTESMYTKPKAPAFQTRTCNCCVTVLPEECFVTCTTCADYDVCLPCHISQKHGHHPLHGFKPATLDTPLNKTAHNLLAPGRGVKHQAICDGCDSSIYGVRHKCLSCPDWDFCSACYKSATQVHPGHRFVPLYEPVNLLSLAPKVTHVGIFCDGPLCSDKPRSITGDRYHCAICNDVDFCADCEAHPGNEHNRTHPVIKLKTAVRNLTCATEDEVRPGSLLGDIRSFRASDLKPTTHAATQVQTVADVEPSVEAPKPAAQEKPAPVSVKEVETLEAEFVTDTVKDGTVMAPGQKFSQTWTLKNTGTTAWPAGVRVQYVGGDDMFMSQHDENILGRVTTTEQVEVGEVAHFSVHLTTPEVARRRVISYWRLTAADGQRFGHKLWCDIEVEEEKAKEIKQEEDNSATEDETIKGEHSMDSSISSASSEMVFPKLEKESVILKREAPSSSEPESATETDGETTLPAVSSAMHSPAWTLTMSEGEDQTSDAATSEDDVESLMLDDEEYEVLETSDDDGYRHVI